MLHRPRPLSEPRRVLEASARSYLPAVAAGVAIGLLLLAVLLIVDLRGRQSTAPVVEPTGTLILEPVDPVASVPLGAFGACLQERLSTVAPAGDETAADMASAQATCLPLLTDEEPDADDE